MSFYKQHRAILESDVIHLRRADGRDWDGILHVNPSLPEKGLAVFYNPTDKEIDREIAVPLYYTGLTEMARVQGSEGEAKTLKLDRDYRVQLPVKIKPGGVAWYVIR